MRVLSAIVLGACVALPVQDRPSPGMVSVETVQADDEVCVRVGNGTAAPLDYGQIGEERTNLWLDRHIWAGRWRTQSSAPARRTVFFQHSRESEDRSIAAGAFFYKSVLYRSHTWKLPPGRYRACFRFLQGDQTEWQESCSAPFRLPPTVKQGRDP